VDVEGNEEPIEAGLLSSRSSARRPSREQNYLMRKHTLEYDDVMNEQRRVIYALRDQVLEGGNMAQAARRRSPASSSERSRSTPDEYAEDWDLDTLFGGLLQIYPVSIAR